MYTRHLSFLASFAATVFLVIRAFLAGVSPAITLGIVLALASAVSFFTLRNAVTRRALALGVALGLLRGFSATATETTLPELRGPAQMMGTVVYAQTSGPESSIPRTEIRFRDLHLRAASSAEAEVKLDRLTVYSDASDHLPTPGLRMVGDVWLETGSRGIWARARPHGLREVGGWTCRLSQSRERFRERCRRGFDRFASAESALLLRALVLGDRIREPARLQAFRRAGASHFLSVSGLHLGLVVALLSPLLLRPGPMRGVALFLIVAYAYLTGARAPVLRALAFFATLLMAGRLRRPIISWQVIIFVAALAMAWRPESARQPGFVLSFAAVIGISSMIPSFYLTTPRSELEAFLQRKGIGARRRRLGYALLVPWGAMVATSPFVVELAGGLSWTALLASVILSPLIAALLAIGIVATALPWLAGVANPISWLVLRLVDGLSTIPGAWVPMPVSPPWAVLAHFIILAISARRAHTLQDPGAVRRARMYPILGLLILALSGAWMARGQWSLRVTEEGYLISRPDLPGAWTWPVSSGPGRVGPPAWPFEPEYLVDVQGRRWRLVDNPTCLEAAPRRMRGVILSRSMAQVETIQRVLADGRPLVIWWPSRGRRDLELEALCRRLGGRGQALVGGRRYHLPK